MPRSKSLAQRELLCAALASGETHISQWEGGEDIEAALSFVRALGVVRAESEARLTLHGGTSEWPREPLELGESGTLARLATAIVALHGPTNRAIELHASGSLRSRSSSALYACLRNAGARLEAFEGSPRDGWPVAITGIESVPTLELEEPASSQEVSGLLLALAGRTGPRELLVRGAIPSRPYLDLTLSVLERYGVTIEEEQRGNDTHFVLMGTLQSPGEVTIEPDASAAAVGLAAACLSGGRISIPGLGTESGTRQGDVRIVDWLRAAGCDARATEGALEAQGVPRQSFDIDLTGEPDLAPVMAAVAARVVHGNDQRCVLRGLETLPGKESSRIEVLAEGLRCLGFAVEADSKSLSVAGGTAHERDLQARSVLDPAADHRMAFAFALCSLFVPGVFVADPECVGKSWPSFWNDFVDSGARLVTV